MRIYAQHIGDGAPGQPLQAGCHARATDGGTGRCLRLGLDGVQQRQPAALAGLNQHLVANGLAAHAQLRRGHGFCHGVGLPVAAIKLAEYRATEVQGVARRLLLARCIEANAQRHAVVHGQRCNLAHAHVLRQARATRHIVRRHTPQRRHARKEQKQRDHDRRTPERQPARRAQRLHQRRFARRHVRVNQCGEQSHQAQHHGEGNGQRLGIEEVAEQYKKAQKEHHHGVAPRAQLQGFEGQQHDDQRHACIAAHNGFVCGPGGSNGKG